MAPLKGLPGVLPPKYFHPQVLIIALASVLGILREWL